MKALGVKARERKEEISMTGKVGQPSVYICFLIGLVMAKAKVR